MSAHVPGEQYLYIVSPDGKIHVKPCKFGISVNPLDNLSTIRGVYQKPPLAHPSLREKPPVDLIRIYECEKDALGIETSLKRVLREDTLDRTEEWVKVEAGKLAGWIEETGVCSRVDPSRF